MVETTALYKDYHAWKGWRDPFRWSPEEGLYYAAELGGSPVGLDIMEIGFGAGGFLGWARDNGARVSGSELTTSSVRAATEADIALHHPDFERYGGLPADSLDVVVAFDVFEHIDPSDIPAKLGAIAHALRPGGKLIMRYPNGQSPFGLIAQHGDATHIVALSRSKMEQYAAGSGLRTLRYGSAASVRTGGLTRELVRVLRNVLQRVHARIIHFAYATDVELAPVVTHVMVHSGVVPSADFDPKGHAAC